MGCGQYVPYQWTQAPSICGRGHGHGCGGSDIFQTQRLPPTVAAPQGILWTNI